MPHPPQPSLILLAVVSGTSSFSLAIILPAIPQLAEQYETDLAGAQFLVSAYLFGLALSQPLWGQVTDRIGRRPVVLWGFAVYTAASFAAMVPDDLLSVSALRALQAAGASTGTVVARAAIRDSFSAEDGAHAMSWISIGLGAAPIVAPIIGGSLLLTGSSDGLFIVMGLAGVVLWLLLLLTLPETRAVDAPRPPWSDLLGGYAQLLGSRAFVGYTAVYGLVQGGFFAFLAVGAAVFTDSFDLGPGVFGVVWGFMGVAYVLGAVIGGRLSKTHRRPLLLPNCIVATLGLGVLVLLLDLVLGATPFTVLVPLFFMMTLSGCATPLVMAGAVYQIPHLAGTAAGLSSAAGMTLSGGFTVAAGFFYAGDFTPIAALIALSGALTFASWLLVRQE